MSETLAISKNSREVRGCSETLRALVVDGDSVFVHHLCQLLRQCSDPPIHLTHCRNLQELQRFDVPTDFDVVLLDKGTCEFDDIESSESLLAQIDQQPLILLTEDEDESTLLASIGCSAQDVLRKSAIEVGLLTRSLRLAIERQRRRSLELRNMELDQFATIVAHDLQSPLKAVESLASWIAADTDSQISMKSCADLSTLRGRVVRMSDMISGLLAYCRASEVHAERRQVNCGRLLSEVIALLDVPLGMTIHVADALPTFTTAQVPLETCLRNLIGNAIKHHDRREGRIEIACHVVDDYFEFTITDDGPGIPGHFHERIFLALETLAPRDQVESSGMGLALVRRTAEAHHGYVEVESDGERGSTFRLGWPRPTDSLSQFQYLSRS